MKRAFLPVLFSLALLAGCQSTSPRPVEATNQPPVAKRIPHVTTIHGDRLVDNYYWLREKDNPEVLAYLKAENAYTDRFMKPTKSFQDKIYNEKLSRVVEPDESVPSRAGEWLYYKRTEELKQYPIYCRKKGSVAAPEEIFLDLNEMAKGKEFFDIGASEVSDDGKLLAFSTDETGFRDYTLHVKDLTSGVAILSDNISNVSAAAWAANNRTLFYVTEDDARRPNRVWRHNLGEKDDALVYEEKDALFDVDMGKSRSPAVCVRAH